MPAPFNIVRNKLHRAIAAYLISVNAGTAADVFAYESTSENKYPNTTIRSNGSRPSPHFTGSREILIQISVKGSAVLPDGETDTNQPVVAFNSRVAATADAMLQTADNQTFKATTVAISAAGRALAVDASNGADPVQKQIAADNADMVDFTCQFIVEGDEADGTADEEGCSWENVLTYTITACASNVD